MKKFLTGLTIFVLTLSCAGCLKWKTDNLKMREYVSYDELTENYSLEDAKKDGCLVFEDSHLTSGVEEWQKFLRKTEAGDSAQIRIAYYHTLDPDHVASELYEEIKDDYPKLFIMDLSFDGSDYHLYHTEDKEVYKDEYPYLVHYTGKPKSQTASFSRYDCYILVNDKNVTYEQLEKSIYSSNTHDRIDHRRVYTDFIKE